MTVADHDGHTINVGVPDRIGPPTIDTDALRRAVCLRSDGVAHATIYPVHADLPAVVVAEHIWRDCIGDIWRPESHEPAAVFLAALRDMFTPNAIEAAAAKVQGVQT